MTGAYHQRQAQYNGGYDALSSCNSDNQYSIVDSLSGLESFRPYDRLGEAQWAPEGRSSSSSLPVGALPQSTPAEEETAARVGGYTTAAVTAACGSIERMSPGGSTSSPSASSTSAALRMAQAELARLRRLVEERRAKAS